MKKKLLVIIPLALLFIAASLGIYTVAKSPVVPAPQVDCTEIMRAEIFTPLPAHPFSIASMCRKATAGRIRLCCFCMGQASAAATISRR